MQKLMYTIQVLVTAWFWISFKISIFIRSIIEYKTPISFKAVTMYYKNMYHLLWVIIGQLFSYYDVKIILKMKYMHISFHIAANSGCDIHCTCKNTQITLPYSFWRTCTIQCKDEITYRFWNHFHTNTFNIGSYDCWVHVLLLINFLKICGFFWFLVFFSFLSSSHANFVTYNKLMKFYHENH